MAKKVGEVIVDTLIAAGVKRVYGIVGDSLNGVTDIIRQHPDVQWVHVRHEETAAFAAGADAHLTEGLAVCAGSCGPGNLHLINGLYDAHRSRVPVLAIAAHIPSSEVGSGYFQETHPELLFKECSHYCELVSHPSQIPRVLEIAMRTAIARQGVAVVIIPGDIELQEAVSDAIRPAITQVDPLIRPAGAELKKAADILNAAEKITILGGAGCKGAHHELMEIAGMLKAPIVHALRGKEFIEYDNPYDVGMTGLLGFSSGYHAMMDSDAILMLGTDFPYGQFYPPHAKIIQVDIRGEQIGRRTKVDLGLVGDVKYTLRGLAPLLDHKKNSEHLDASLAHYKKTRSSLDDLAKGEPGHTPIHPEYVAKMMNELANDDAIFTCDVGTPTVWAARYLSMNGKRRLLGSFIHGSMANALPQAIGAQVAFPHRQVVTMSGDGGLAMLMGDLLTLTQHKLPVKMIVFNNGSLGFVETEMKASGLLDFGTDLQNPDFSKMADAMGIKGFRVEKPEDVEPMMKATFEYDGPALLDVVVNRQELFMPPTITLQQAIGFNLYMIKAVLNGKGNEVIDLAKSNLFDK